MPHFNQDTQVSIESYHGALKHWFALTQKALEGVRLIGWCGDQQQSFHAITYTHWKWKKKNHKKQGYGGHYYTKCGKNSPYFTHPCVQTNL
jgi:hypothetical protein